MENHTKLPEWMNDDFFTEVIKKHSSDAKLIDFVIKPSSTLGIHYGSMMFRGDINYSTNSEPKNTLSIVIKALPTGVQGEFIGNLPIFKIEQDMFGGPLPEIKSLLESVGDFSNIHPKVIYQTTKPNRIIVMEDLSSLGYENVMQPLEDFEESKMVFKRLAKFHAAGFFLINERKVDLSRFSYSIFHVEDENFIKTFFLEPIDIFTEVLASWGGHEEYVRKLKIFREKCLEQGEKLFAPNANGYNVLNHGDFHVKNLLFKKVDSKITDCFFLDYQVCLFASPCVDLFYALYNMISDENRTNRRSEIIFEYHSEFVDTLKRLGFIGKIPSLLDLQMDLVRFGFMEVFKCICYKIFFWVDNSDVNISSLLEGDSKALKKYIYNDPKFKEFIKVELPRLVHMGFL